MTPLTKLRKVRHTSGFTGKAEVYMEQEFEIESSDIGQQWPHHTGHNRAWYKVTEEDVGKRILYTKQGNHYQHWDFL